MHQRREIKKQFEVAVSGVTHKLKTEDVLNILWPKMVDVKMCGSAENVSSSDGD